MSKLIALAFFIVCMFLLPACTDEQPVSQEMTSEKALKAIKEIIPEGKVLDVKETPVQGLFEIAIETKGRKGIIYLDSSGKYLISGSIVDVATKENLTQERSAEIIKVDVSKIPLEDTLLMGSKDAAKKVIVFTDPD